MSDEGENKFQGDEDTQLDLDELDVEIVQLLHKDGRTAFTEIAKKVGVSEATIRNRVQRLTSSGAITIQAYLNPNKLGFRNIALIELKMADLDRAQTIASELVDQDSVSYVAFVAGSYDLFVEVTYDTNEGLLNFLAALRAKTGVSNCETAIVLKLLKTQYSFQIRSTKT
ncbi:Lrp/AsnC family transcriptional regulator [Phormidium sp. CLA17]|uniref:Lrp/AsnC family transcriptional regulator n=1 Tax=Leptolyngbya sp. Cla-17 TaxID=2803751 RepID=UPI0014929497|nr:Lrp/AsnC family transcriptional regulator [Leptolyngbya sp. Cla-17]MBM0744478.1 Lrp/AsnC family transcriptional regulator [Leptolyngbya sp. Cla-17]